MSPQQSPKVIMYHNPRCSKSRQALDIIKQYTQNIELRLYLTDGITADEVVMLTKMLNMHPSEFVRKKEPAFKTLESDEFSIEEWSAIIEEHPILLERPIVIVEHATGAQQAIVARPPELVRQVMA